MRTIFGLIFLGLAITLNLATLPAQPKAQDKITFEAKYGKVTFDHVAHVKRAKNDCKGCHDKLFPQSTAPINYKAAMHKTAEAAKASCGGCHNPAGPGFESKANCTKCHVKG